MSSFIRNERYAREARQAAALAPLWTGEAWRDHRATMFKPAFTKACEEHGVPYKVKQG